MNKADDYEIALEMARKLCASNNDPDKWEKVLEDLAKAMSADSVQLTYVCTRNKKSIMSVEIGQPLAPLIRWAGINEISIRDAVPLSESIENYKAIDMHFAFLEKEWGSNYPLSRQGTGPEGVEHAFLCADRFPELNLMVVLALTRSDKTRPFSSEDIEFLALIKDMMHQSMYTFASFFIKQIHIQSMRAMIDRGRVGLIMIDSAGYSLVANDKADEVMQRGDTFDLNRNGYFHLHREDLDKELKQYLSRTRDSLSYNSAIDELYLRIEPKQKESGYLFVVCPVETTMYLPTTCDDTQKGLFLVQIIDLSDEWSLEPAALQKALDITAAEAEVLKCLSEGAQLREIADSKGRSYHTIRNHLQKVMNKTGLHRQADLMLLVHSVVSAGAAKSSEELKTDIA